MDSSGFMEIYRGRNQRLLLADSSDARDGELAQDKDPNRNPGPSYQHCATIHS